MLLDPRAHRVGVEDEPLRVAGVRRASRTSSQVSGVETVGRSRARSE